jgi:BPG-independent PGAM N-terminus (iPGM_N)
VHSHQGQIAALARIVAEAGVPVAVHAILDGRDTPPKSAKGYLKQFAADTKGADVTVGVVSGRYYAMDRDKRWDRVEKAYRTLTAGEGETAADPIAAVDAAYERDETDEFVLPTAIAGYKGMKDGDGLLLASAKSPVRCSTPDFPASRASVRSNSPPRSALSNIPRISTASSRRCFRRPISATRSARSSRALG